ncbi:helix-turn-helix domain-containing protein [Turicibacter sanguinis]|uniref:helix-turn-helix domain-containing protein n=1 Tax=Turicibacter sanguinis TaxID=154288 RepID=UPI0006C07606|nr:helix-turn-helix transcriptional regulator [Turicibacter sanguinis]MCU7196520.1 helix-turn-helix domain-containing protein [Turicibacter sanguinis]MTP71630.1 helix-turn-helix domain-containing protein [Turicibacter sanguinis]MTP79250.1 helix-turn-helix domain-containing protein [Turicibacter sanguinis]CUM80156.1 Helix-turn-helix [Turicibacter sanguinis]
MILTISEKIKHARMYFGLSQRSFKRYGIGQNYLSMIESGKRNPSKEMLEAIYNALFELTGGEIESLYSKNRFIMNFTEEFELWFFKKYETVETIINNYEECLNLLKENKKYDVAYKIHMMIAGFYQSKSNYDLSNDFLLKAIDYGSSVANGLSKIYRHLGLNMRRNLDYKNALVYYTLALKYLEGDIVTEYYKISYDIALTNLNLGNVEKAMSLIDIILEECEDLPTRGATYLLRAGVLFRMQRDVEGREVLEKYIENPCYEPYIDYAYNNLVDHYFEKEEYDKALTIALKFIENYPHSANLVSPLLLISQIYEKLGRNEEAFVYLMQIKEDILLGRRKHIKESFCQHALNLFLKLNRYDEIEKLFFEVEKCDVSEKFKSDLKLSYFMNKHTSILNLNIKT